MIDFEHGEYHHRDGVFFARMQDGSVRIRKWDIVKRPADIISHDEIVFEHVIPPSEWASIVAEVSAGGGDASRFHAASVLHASDGAVLVTTPVKGDVAGEEFPRTS